MRPVRVDPWKSVLAGAALTISVTLGIAFIAAAQLMPGQQAAPLGETLNGNVAAPPGRLSAGDTFFVTAWGPTGGTATFSIPGLRSDLPMAESGKRPGLYIGSYTVQPGDSVTNGSVIITLTRRSGPPLTVTLGSDSVGLWIDASPGSPPTAPKVPAITMPAQGSSVTTPFTVTGTALPRSRVWVTAEYAERVPGVTGLGTFELEIVVADAHGNWSTIFTRKPTVPGVKVTITASVIVNGTFQDSWTTVMDLR